MITMRLPFLFKTIIALSIVLLSLPAGVFASDYTQAVKFYKHNHFQKALGLFQSAQEEGIHPARSSYYIALCYHHLHDKESAKSAYLNVIKKYPRSSEAKNAFLALSKLEPSLIPGAKVKRPSTTQIRDDEISVRYRHLKGSNHIIVDAYINSKPTIMMVDTGAALSFCRESFLEKNNIVVRNAKPSIRLSGVGGEVSTKEALVNITVGRMTRTTPLMIEQDQARTTSSNSEFLSIPILGQNFFKDMVLKINDRNRILSLKRLPDDLVSNRSKTNKVRADAALEVPFFREENKIIIKAKVNGRECEMILDTGADTVVFADRHLLQYGLSRPTEARNAKSGGVGGVRDGFSFKLDKMVLGPIIKKNVDCTLVLNSRFSRPLLGQSFLKGLIYTIDPSQKVVIFDRSNRNEF